MNDFKTKNVLESFKYAIDGIGYAFKTHRNFRIHIVILVIVTFIGFYLKIHETEWMFILLCYSTVLTSEIFNTCVEEITDNFIGNNFSDHARIIKDLGAAAVLITTLCSSIIGLIIFVPKILLLI